MSYRNLTVDGRVYQYTIGKEFTHIRGVGRFSHRDIGDTVRGMTDPRTNMDKFIVTPRCVANAIKGVHNPIELVRDSEGKLVKYVPYVPVPDPDSDLYDNPHGDPYWLCNNF